MPSPTSLSPETQARGHQRTLRAASPLVVLACLGLAACAPSGRVTEPGPKLVQAAAHDLAQTHRYEVVASFGDGTSRRSMDFQVEAANVGNGSFTMGSLSFQAEEVGGVDYFRSRNLWASVGGSALQSALGDDWVYIAADTTTALQLTQAFASLTSTKALAQSLRAAAAGAGRGRVATFQGQAAILVPGSGGARYWIAASGHPRLLGARGLQDATLRLSHFGERFSIRPPRHALSLAGLLAS